MINGRVVRLRRENAQLREKVALLGELANVEDHGDELTPSERVQAEAIDLVSNLTGMPWMSHQRFRDVANAILIESNGALEVLDSGDSLDDYRERQW